MNSSNWIDAFIYEHGHLLYIGFFYASLVFIGLMLAWRKPPVPPRNPTLCILLLPPQQAPPPEPEPPPILGPRTDGR